MIKLFFVQKKIVSVLRIMMLSCLLVCVFSACGVYTFKDVSIDYSKIKTIKIFMFENKAGTINPQLGSRLTDQFQQKVSSQTKLTRTNDDNAHYQVQGTIVSYRVTTAAISNQQATTNRLTVGVHIVFKNTVDNKTDEFDVSRDFDFAGGLTIDQAQGRLNDEIVKNLSDEIFNRIFSNW